MDKAFLKTLILSTKGKFFSIRFRKANGEIRVANGKNFYRRLIVGGDSCFKESSYVPLVDRNKGDGEWIPAHGDKVLSFKCGSIVYPFEG
jgi:hypothetical protein